jgi:simple sugar transport system substrate-binding protein
MQIAAEDFADYGVKAECTGVDNYTEQNFNAALEAAIARQPAVLISAGNEKESERAALAKAIEQGIKVVLAAGAGQIPGDAEDLGAMVFVGSSYYEEGRAMGTALGNAGVTNVICRNPGPGIYPFDARCGGTKDALAEIDPNIKFQEITMPFDNSVTSKNTLVAALTADPTVDGLANCESSQYADCREALEQTGRWGNIKVAYVDINAQEAQDIVDGNAIFATTQQGFLEGYLAVAIPALNLEYGVLPGGLDRIVPTGPLNIDASNVADLIPYLESGNF